MCTSIAFSQYALYGRNLDLECGFGEQVAIAPRNLVFSFHHQEPMRNHYAMIGMASMAGVTPLFAEAANDFAQERNKEEWQEGLFTGL